MPKGHILTCMCFFLFQIIGIFISPHLLPSDPLVSLKKIMKKFNLLLKKFAIAALDFE